MKTALVKIFVISSLTVLFTGCAISSSDMQKFRSIILGSDIQGLRDIKEAHTQVFDKDIPRCYKLTTQALLHWKAIRAEKRKDDYIVAMGFENVFGNCINTTELGIFFTQTGPHKTEVKVTSLNHRLSELIAPKLFEYIEKDGKVPREERLKPSTSTSARNLLKSKSK